MIKKSIYKNIKYNNFTRYVTFRKNKFSFQDCIKSFFFILKSKL